MSTIQTTTPAVGATPSAKEQFLDTYDREHKTTMRVLRAYPQDKLDLRPHEKCKSAWELAWVFVAERGLGTLVFQDAFAKGGPTGDAPSAPDSWEEILAALDQAHAEFGDLVRSTPEDKLGDPVKFFTGPKTMGDVTRMQLLWFLLHDEIHHRGQFSVYLRMAGAKVPSIYGPTADEPWM
jgi:uncharacterized damage-inducible protein DinB